jgi:hypothetical protein
MYISYGQIDTISYSLGADISKIARVLVRIHDDISIKESDNELSRQLFGITKP